MEDVWPFTSKVWAALAAAHSQYCKPHPSLNAARTIPPPNLLADNPAGDAGVHASPFVVAQMQETSAVVVDFCEPWQAPFKISANLCSASGIKCCDSNAADAMHAT